MSFMFIKPDSVYNLNRIMLLLSIKHWLTGRSCVVLEFGTFLVTWRFLIAFPSFPLVPRPPYFINWIIPFSYFLSVTQLSISWISFLKLLCSVLVCLRTHVHQMLTVCLLSSCWLWGHQWVWNVPPLKSLQISRGWIQHMNYQWILHHIIFW